MPGAVMKSLVRWGATLALAGSAIIGSSLIGSMRVLGLPQDQIVKMLAEVPVFTITDASGAPLVATVPNGQKKATIAGVFINEKDAQSFVDQLKTKNPNLAKTVRVVAVSLGQVYQLNQTNQNKRNSVDFDYVPDRQQVSSALTLLQQSGQKVNEFPGVPLFVATGKQGKGYMTIKRNNQQIVPFFFKKEDLQSLLERFKQQKPDLAATVEIQVVPLQAVIQKLKTGNDANLNQIVLVPPQESVDFVRSLQSAPTQNQSQPAPSPSPVH